VVLPSACGGCQSGTPPVRLRIGRSGSAAVVHADVRSAIIFAV